MILGINKESGVKGRTEQGRHPRLDQGCTAAHRCGKDAHAVVQSVEFLASRWQQAAKPSGYRSDVDLRMKNRGGSSRLRTAAIQLQTGDQNKINDKLYVPINGNYTFKK